MFFNVNRRNFLKTVVVSAGVVVVGVAGGCNDDDNNDADTKSAPEVLTDPHFFPQSVISRFS